MKQNSLIFIVAALLSLANSVTPLAIAGTVSFNYDRAGRITDAQFVGNKSVNYTYDSAGNLLQRAINVGGSNPDSDNDGMEDAWEITYFGSKEARDGTDDLDLDGFSDLAEFLAGTLPNDPNSALKVLPTLAPNAGSVTIQWSAVANKTYRLQFKNSLNENGWSTVAGDVTADGAIASKIDPAATNPTGRFYRVLLVP